MLVYEMPSTRETMMGLDNKARNAREDTKALIEEPADQDSDEGTLAADSKAEHFAPDTKELIQNEEARDALT